jgi:diguanylate cyclase (GGDEF)-like protein
LKSGYVCVPLAAQGETLGVLYIENAIPKADSLEEDRRQWEKLERTATAAADRISLALGNLNLREILRNQSIRDPLTGLFNRRYMEESLARELHRATRKQRNVALVMLDVDHFKDFNDTFGHQAGDSLLQELAGTLKSRVRAGDVACRYGGEEFALILSETDAHGAFKCMEHVQDEIRQYHLHLRGQALGPVTISAGVAVFPDHADGEEGLIRAADLALYRAKEEGRNKVLMGPALMT